MATSADAEDNHADARTGSDADPSAGHASHGHAPAEATYEPNYYRVLGLTPSADAEAIRQAYRRLAKQWHPDQFTQAAPDVRAQAERRMRLINRAHDVLHMASSRHAYDLRHSPASATTHATYASHASHAPHAAHRYDDADYASMFSTARNPNGAGQLVTVLCVVVALGLGGHLLRDGAGGTVQAFIIVTVIMTLGVLAVLFADGDSLLARAATDYIEREPTVHHAARRHHAGRAAGGGRRPRYANSPHPFASASGDAQRHTPDAEQQNSDDFDAVPEVVNREPTPFELLVDEALATVPRKFAGFMQNIVVQVEDAPDAATLRRLGVEPGATLLGLYVGVPLTQHTLFSPAPGIGPEIITIYQQTIERYCDSDPDRIREQVRATVLHELAHHFGIDHDDMPAWVK